MIVVYRSEATAPLSAEALSDLARRSAEKNRTLGITGFLVERDGIFLQALEGKAAAVEPLLDIFAKDTRHHAMEVLHQDATSVERDFGSWEMNAIRLTDPVLRGTIDAMLPQGMTFAEASRETDFAIRTLMCAYVHACIAGGVTLYGLDLD